MRKSSQECRAGQPATFRILGPLEVEADGHALPLGGHRDKTLLAMLVLNAGHAIRIVRLIDAIWDEDPPPTAAKQVRNAVSRLRPLLNGPAQVAIASTGDTYRLDVGNADIDAQQFLTAVTHARRHSLAGQADSAAQVLSAALSLWRGPLLAGMTGRVIDAAVAEWEERRRGAQQAYLEQLIVLGRDEEALGDLTAAHAADPLCEKSARLLMTAMYRCGRQAAALDVFDRLRGALSTTLGLDPGPETWTLHRLILAHDPALTAIGLDSRRLRDMTRGEGARTGRGRVAAH